MGPRIDDHGALRLVEPEFIVLCGMAIVKWDVECRVEADTKTQFLLPRVFHGQGMVDGLALQPERTGQDKIKGKLCFFQLRAGA